MFTFLSTILLTTNSFALNTVSTGYQLATNELRTIVAHNTCKKVWNTSATSPQFVSTKSSMEWTNFYVNHPSDIVVRDCNVSCSNLKKAGDYTSGFYSVDLDGAGPLTALSVYCDLTNDGGGWTKVYNHYTAGGFFPTINDAKLYNQATPTSDLYSILQYIDNLENLNRLTFKLYYPELGKKNIWSQFNNPIYDTRVLGYRDITLDMKDQKWGGLEYGNGSYSSKNGNSALIDGAVEHSNWYYAIGTTAIYKGGIPGPHNNDTGLTQVELYVHDGGYHPMSCEHILELGESKGSGVYTIYPDQVNPVSVYCEMDIDNGGWSLFYANAAATTMTDKRSYNSHLADLSGIPITSSNFSDANTVGMIDFKKFNSTQMMARDITNWGASDYSTVEFFNPKDFNSIVSLSFSPVTTTVGDCDDLTGGLQFKFRNSNGANYYMDKAANWIGFGWGDCTAGYTQTSGSDVHDAPRHYIYDSSSAADANRVRGVGGFNTGDLTVKGRYFLREKYDRPKNCMDILLNGKSKGSGSYTIYPEGNAVTVDCDMTSQGGGWTKVWHGYPTHAAVGHTATETYSKSNSIAFNQMKMEGVNLGFSIVDNTWKTAYLDKTIPNYFAQVIAQDDATSPRVKFADMDGVENVGLVGNYFLHGYSNNWRVFYSCVNVDSNTADRVFVGGTYGKYCAPRTNFVPSSITTCTSSLNNYCTNAYSSTEVDTGLSLTLKKYQETRVWVRSLPSMKSCREILDQGFSTGSGTYLIDPDGPSGATVPFPTYCDMTTNGGGWTLVWGNTKGGTNKPVTAITMANAISTLPRCSLGGGATSDVSGQCNNMYSTTIGSTSQAALEKFNYFVGLKHWDTMAKGKDFQMLYQWSYANGSGVDQEVIMNVKNFDPALDYQLDIDSYTQTIGAVLPGIVGTHNHQKFTTFDDDNDNHASNCGDLYSDTPFWYNACWSGNFNGGGEAEQDGYFNGAYWVGSAKQDGDQITAAGAGNGWFFIREKVSTARLKSSCKDILDEDPSAPSGVYTIDYLVGLDNNQFDVYCDMTTDGGGWTLVTFSNGTATATIPDNVFVEGYNSQFAYDYTRANYSSSINPEAFSRAVGTTDAMLISPSYNAGTAIIDNGFGIWDYNNTKCTGSLFHTSRTAGCTGQNANDNFDGADAFNIAISSGNEGIVPAYKATEVCYSGKGSCSFQFFLR